MDTEETRRLELKGLSKACDQAGSLHGIIITAESEEEIEYADISVSIIPAWKWCTAGFDLYHHLKIEE